MPEPPRDLPATTPESEDISRLFRPHEVGPTVLKYVDLLPPQYDEPVRYQLEKAVYPGGPRFRDFMELTPEGADHALRAYWGLANEAHQFTREQIEIRGNLITDTGETLSVRVTSGHALKSYRQSHDYQVRVDVFNENRQTGKTMRIDYEPGDTFGWFAVTDYEISEHDGFSERREHSADCQLRGSEMVGAVHIPEVRELPQPGEIEHLHAAGQRVVERFSQLGLENEAVDTRLRSGWDLYSDLEVLRGVFETPEGKYISMRAWEYLASQAPHQLAKPAVYRFPMRVHGELVYAALLPTKRPLPVKYMNSEVVVREFGEGQHFSVMLDRGYPVIRGEPIVNERHPKVTLEYNEATHKGTYRLEQYPRATGVMGTDARVAFSERTLLEREIDFSETSDS